MSAGTKPSTSAANSSLLRPGRQAEQAEQQLADLQQDPGCDEVQRRHSKDVATLQFRDYGHATHPQVPTVGNEYYVPAGSSARQSEPF